MVTSLRWALAVSGLGGMLLALGCRQAPPMAAGPVRHYPITGRVVGTNTESDEVELAAAAIPGFMDAMTMPYRLKDPTALKALHRGDQVAGTLEVGADGTVLENARVTDRSGEIREPVPQSQMKPLVPGEAVPDFSFLDQSGKTIRLSQYSGRAVVLTFVYTHCPLADYCPKMSRNFAEVDKALAGDPALYDRTHLLSVSFDPVRDTPAVLRSYGGAYTGQYTNETFAHWSFAAPPQAELGPVLEFFDVSAVPSPGGTLTHSLSTIVIGPDGRIVHWYGGNEWTPAQVMADLKRALGVGA